MAGRASRRGEDLLAECDIRGRGRCGGGVVRPLDPDRERDERERAGDRHPPVRPSRVPQVEEEPRPRADRHQDDQHEPRVVGAVGEREVPGEHRQQNRQREVVVLDRALFRLDARSRVGLATGLLRADELALRRDDVEEDVRGHHRPDHRPDLEPRRPRAEELATSPTRRAPRAAKSTGHSTRGSETSRLRTS